MKTQESHFWLEKTITEFTPEEWESLCDGCGKCCLHKLRDAKSGRIYFTNVVCRYSDLKTCQCTDYENRHENVPTCVFLTPKMAVEADWLPKTCAYRRIARGEGLLWWHPLVSGDIKSVQMSGNSIVGRVVQENEVDLDDLEDMVVEWFD